AIQPCMELVIPESHHSNDHSNQQYEKHTTPGQRCNKNSERKASTGNRCSEVEPPHRIVSSTKFLLAAPSIDTGREEPYDGGEAPADQSNQLPHRCKARESRLHAAQPLRLLAAQLQRTSEDPRTSRPKADPRLLPFVLQARCGVLV